MKNICGFIAIMGILSAIAGIVTPFTALATVICGALYLFYPSEYIDRYNENKEREMIQEEIWELEKEQDATFTSYSPSRQEKIDKLTNQLKNL